MPRFGSWISEVAPSRSAWTSSQQRQAGCGNIVHPGTPGQGFAGRAGNWCERRDSNSHGLPHWHLKPARLPIPPLSHASIPCSFTSIPLYYSPIPAHYSKPEHTARNRSGSMYALLVFVLLLVSVLIASAALAWPLQTLLTLWFEPELESVISRTVLGLGILVFLAVFRKAGFSSWRDIGFGPGFRQFWGDAARGFAAGILIMAPVVAGLLLVQNRVPDLNWDWSAGSLAALLASALVAGSIVALIEETLFRGALLTAVLRRSSVLLAVVSTSLFYSLVHFLQPEQELDPHSLDWASGFVLLLDAVVTLLKPLPVPGHIHCAVLRRHAACPHQDPYRQPGHLYRNPRGLGVRHQGLQAADQLQRHLAVRIPDRDLRPRHRVPGRCMPARRDSGLYENQPAFTNRMSLKQPHDLRPDEEWMG